MSEDNPLCEFGVRLTRAKSEYAGTGEAPAHRMVVTVSEVNNVDPNIFVYLRIPAVNEDSYLDVFQNVASPSDLEDWPAGTPAAEGESFFRLADLDLVTRNAALLDATWDQLQLQVDALMEALRSLCLLDDATSSDHGTLAAEESSTPSDEEEETPPEESSEQEACPIESATSLVITLSYHPNFGEDLELVSSADPELPTCERVFEATSPVTGDVLQLTASLLTHRCVVALDDGGGFVEVDEVDCSDSYSAMFSLDGHTIAVAPGA